MLEFSFSSTFVQQKNVMQFIMLPLGFFCFNAGWPRSRHCCILEIKRKNVTFVLRMKELYIQHIAKLLGIQSWQVENCAQLIADGCTVPFISRYRKERTGGLTDMEVAEVKHWAEVFEEMEKRKASILKTIEEQEKLTPELQKQIEGCVNSSELEDLYLPYRPKRKTRATVAVARGLEPLADLLWKGRVTRPEEEARKYIKGEVTSASEALQGARDIIAERISETAANRETLRAIYRTRRVESKVTKAGSESPEAAKYRSYFNFSQPIGKIRWILTPTAKSAATSSTMTTARRRGILPARPGCR